jgi:hypothetical protein
LSSFRFLILLFSSFKYLNLNYIAPEGVAAGTAVVSVGAPGTIVVSVGAAAAPASAGAAGASLAGGGVAALSFEHFEQPFKARAAVIAKTRVENLNMDRLQNCVFEKNMLLLGIN